MTTVADLVPGDVVDLGDDSATFIARTQHPIWPSMQLVVWRLADGTWSHDALRMQQDVGQARPADVFSRQAELRRTLLGGAS